jgi:hypothetical protein
LYSFFVSKLQNNTLANSKSLMLQILTTHTNNTKLIWDACTFIWIYQRILIIIAIQHCKIQVFRF